MLFRFIGEKFELYFRGVKYFVKMYWTMFRFVIKRIFYICPRQWVDFKEASESLRDIMDDAFSEDFDTEDYEYELGRIKWYLHKHPDGGIYEG